MLPECYLSGFFIARNTKFETVPLDVFKVSIELPEMIRFPFQSLKDDLRVIGKEYMIENVVKLQLSLSVDTWWRYARNK